MNSCSSLALLGSVGAVVMTLAGTAQAATPTFYNDQAAFNAAIPNSVTDPYSNPGYVFIQNNAAMSAVLGETDYVTTGFQELNIVNGGYYCSGCNGSFELTFTSTTVGTVAGVQGVGLKIVTNAANLPYFAFITFADNTTQNVALPSGSSYWGVSAPERIRKIHFGLTMGGSTTSGSFGIDDLVIGDIFPNCQNDASCDDKDMCNGAEKCVANKCTPGTPLVCADDNGCTDDSCDKLLGCVNKNNVAPCDDGDVCTLETLCAEGSCGGGSALDCADDDVCTEDLCDPQNGCGNAPIDGCCKTDDDCADDQVCDPDSNTCGVPMTSSTSTGDTTTGDTSTGGDTSTSTATTGDDTTGAITTQTTTDTPDPTTGGGSDSGGEAVTTTAPDPDPTNPTTNGPTNGESSGSPDTDGSSGSDTAGIDDGGCGCRTDTRGDHLLGALASLGLGLALRRRRRG